MSALRNLSAVVGIFWLVQGHAHLLNMTQALVEINGAGAVSIQLEVDLLAEFGTAENYFAISRTDPQNFAEASDGLFTRLADAIELRQKDVRIPVTVVGVDWPDQYTLGEFRGGLVWPKTKVRLTGQLGTNDAVKVRFLPQFVFEEPIALTLYGESTSQRKSRWLVIGQTSPAFAGFMEGQRSDESVLTGQGLIQLIYEFAQFGGAHIFFDGWDHLLFVFALCLSVYSAKILLIRISLFTVAHSLTLALASYKVVEFNAIWVEYLIVASIAFVGLANIYRPTNNNQKVGLNFDLAYVWILLFGFLHGFGFASSLGSLDVPPDTFLVTLLGFNLGVEIGQITFILFVLANFRFLDQTLVKRHYRVLLSWWVVVIAGAWLMTMFIGD